MVKKVKGCIGRVIVDKIVLKNCFTDDKNFD